MNPSIARAAALAAAALSFSVPAPGATPEDLLRGYEALARVQSTSFAGFSADRGAALFRSTHGGEWSCSTCHTATPNAAGRHARTGSVLQPLAPGANPDRFSDPAKVEKWFRRNCNDVVGRECSAQEKGDVIAFLRSLDGNGSAR